LTRNRQLSRSARKVSFSATSVQVLQNPVCREDGSRNQWSGISRCGPRQLNAAYRSLECLNRWSGEKILLVILLLLEVMLDFLCMVAAPSARLSSFRAAGASTSSSREHQRRNVSSSVNDPSLLKSHLPILSV
jgi:hypothetical protein